MRLLLDDVGQRAVRRNCSFLLLLLFIGNPPDESI